MQKLLINDLKSNNSEVMSNNARKEYHRQYTKDRRRWLKSHCMCVQCKKVDRRTLEGLCLCAECAQKAYERRQRKMKGGE